MRRIAKVDGNQRAIVAYLRAHGCSVVSLATVGGGVPDLRVGRNRVTVLMEVKLPSEVSRKSDTAAMQAAFRATWRGGPVVVVTTPEGAMAALTAHVREVAP